MVEVDSGTLTTQEAPGSAAFGASRNLQRNLAAIRSCQKDLLASVVSITPPIDFLFARDGTLTARENSKWWGGCSVPARAAAELLKTLNITSGVACFLAPSHSAQVAYALSRLRSEQAIIALLPRFDDVIFILHCHDFSADIAAHRLWFAAGEQWPVQLSQILHTNPGLPIPQQFIRTVLLNEDSATPLITTAQKIFSEELNRRGMMLANLRDKRPSREIHLRNRITLAAPMRFRLWDDAGDVLQQLICDGSETDVTSINFDDPAKASPLALAQAAAESNAILTANLTRADCGHFLHREIPLISWLTTRPVPQFDEACPRDTLLLPHPLSLEIAKQSGWPSDRLALFPWPRIAAATASSSLGIIADTRPIDSNSAFDLSSHQLLWDLIRCEIQSDPTLINNDVPAYLQSRMQRLNIADHALDQRRFIEELIIPAYQQSLAMHLLAQKIPLRIFGSGWRELPAFSCHASGPISSREQLQQVVSASSALIHLWPTDHPHPIDSAGPPVLRLTARGIPCFIADARRPLSGNLIKPASPAADANHKATLVRVLRSAMA